MFVIQPCRSTNNKKRQVIQHMLALLAIAFGKDMATATVISLEPFLEGIQPSPTKQVASAAVPPPPPPPPCPGPPPPPGNTPGGDAIGSKGDKAGVGKPQQETANAVPSGAAGATEAPPVVCKKSVDLPRDGCAGLSMLGHRYVG